MRTVPAHSKRTRRCWRISSLHNGTLLVHRRATRSVRRLRSLRSTRHLVIVSASCVQPSGDNSPPTPTHSSAIPHHASITQLCWLMLDGTPRWRFCVDARSPLTLENCSNKNCTLHVAHFARTRKLWRAHALVCNRCVCEECVNVKMCSIVHFVESSVRVEKYVAGIKLCLTRDMN